MADPAEALGFGHERMDEYAGARPGEAGGPRVRLALRILTVLGALVAGYVLAVSLDAGWSAAQAEDERHSELVALVRAQYDRVQDFTATLEELGNRVQRNEQQAAAALVPTLDDAVRRAELAAGLTPLFGPGVVTTLFDAPAGCTGANYLCRIQDYDLQLVANSLFAAGAEAVSVNGQRVIATTAIRSAGSQITANYRFLSPPYEVRAVGDPDALAARLQADGLAEALSEAGSGLRMEVRREEQVEVDGMSSAPTIRIARPAEASP